MANEPGQFQFAEEKGPTGVPQASWVLVNADGDVMAVSHLPLGGKSARAQVQWIMDNAKDCKIIEQFIPFHG